MRPRPYIDVGVPPTDRYCAPPFHRHTPAARKLKRRIRTRQKMCRERVPSHGFRLKLHFMWIEAERKRRLSEPPEEREAPERLGHLANCPKGIKARRRRRNEIAKASRRRNRK